MQHVRCPRLVTAAGALAVVLAASPALAQTGPERACRAAIAKNVTKYVSSVLKAHASCHAKRSRGKLAATTDCNDLADADPGDKLARKRLKLRSAILSACGGAPSLLAQYARCPSPASAADDGEATDGIDSYAEVVACMVGLAEGLAARGARESLGAPAGSLPKATAACQKALGGGLRKLLTAYGKEREMCQAGRDAQSQGLAYACEGEDGRGRIAATAAKLQADIAKRCAIVDPWPLSNGNEALDAIGACGDTIEQLQACVAGTISDALGSGLIAMAYELPADCSAGTLVRRVNAGFGEQITSTSLGAGWNGLAIGIDFTDLFAESLRLTCDADCANCSLAYDAAKTTPGLQNCRCASDASIPCDTLNAPDTDDCGLVPGTNTCHCNFGPPLAINAAGVPACVPIRITQDYSGTVDLGTGEWTNPLQVAAVIHLGEQLLQPCPMCENDVTLNDGVRDGTCVGGARAGLACDANGNHPTFGAVSIDCQPISLKNISGGGLPLNFELISAEQSLPFNLPCDTAGEMCPCRVCSGDTSVGCRGDFECPVGTGTCTGGGGAGVQPNDCDGHDCSPDGLCTTGPDNRYCDGLTHPNGRGAIACQTGADCAVFGAGQCTIVERLRCYHDPITVSGSPGIFGADLGGLACIGLTSSPAINVAAGLPGPVRVGINIDSDVRCEGDPAVSWKPPTGHNCPAPAGTPCGGTFPLCNGSCPGTQTCTTTGLACACQ